MIVDSHQHFWDPGRFDYPWMTPEIEAIRRPFGPDDLEPLLTQHAVDGTVLVQAISSVDETRFLLDIARATAFVAGVVGWVDLTDAEVERTIGELRAGDGGEHLVGVRHQVHDEDDPDWLGRQDVERGLREIAAAGLAFDFLVRTRELPSALRVARSHPDMRFVIDHIGKPPIKDGVVESWERAMEPFSTLDHVSCKLSGMVTEADWNEWTPKQLAPYVERVLGWFGEDRVMFGSDWPVCTLAASYERVVAALDEALGDIGPATRSKIYGANAIRVYGLKVRTEA